MGGGVPEGIMWFGNSPGRLSDWEFPWEVHGPTKYPRTACFVPVHAAMLCPESKYVISFVCPHSGPK